MFHNSSYTVNLTFYVPRLTPLAMTSSSYSLGETSRKKLSLLFNCSFLYIFWLTENKHFIAMFLKTTSVSVCPLWFWRTLSVLYDSEGRVCPLWFWRTCLSFMMILKDFVWPLCQDVITCPNHITLVVTYSKCNKKTKKHVLVHVNIILNKPIYYTYISDWQANIFFPIHLHTKRKKYKYDQAWECNFCGFFE